MTTTASAAAATALAAIEARMPAPSDMGATIFASGETARREYRPAARVMALTGLTGLRILTDAPARKAVRPAFRVCKAGNDIPPPCDCPPPINFHRPEYVTTPRGRDWWLPALMQDA